MYSDTDLVTETSWALLQALDAVCGDPGELCLDCAGAMIAADRTELETAAAELEARGIIDEADGRFSLTGDAEWILRRRADPPEPT